MLTTILLKLTGAFLLMLIGAIGFTKKFAELWHQGNKIPKILLDLFLGFCLLLTQIGFVTALYCGLINTSEPLLMTFDNFPFLFLFTPGILAFFKPVQFNKPAAIYEIPLLFALCLVYLLFGLGKGQNLSIYNYSILLSFLFFCFDMFRMQELGNYDSPVENNFSEKKALAITLIWALVFATASVTMQKFSTDLLSIIYDDLLAYILYFFLMALPYLCVLITLLHNKIPWEIYLRANILRNIIFCSLILPIDMILRHELYQSFDLNILTIDTIIIAFLWYSITCLKKINRLTGIGMLLAYFIYIYYILR